MDSELMDSELMTTSEPIDDRLIGIGSVRRRLNGRGRRHCRRARRSPDPTDARSVAAPVLCSRMCRSVILILAKPLPVNAKKRNASGGG